MGEPVAGETAADSAPARAYQPIGNYAAIGDCHGSALVASDGGIDWCCLGRFDADPIFCRLLDADRGGFLSVTTREKSNVTRAYIENTNILRTEFRTASGRIAVTDFMPVGRDPAAGPYDYVTLNAPGWLVRRIEGVEGRVDLHVTYRPSIAFARRSAQLEVVPGGIALEGDQAVLRSDLPLRIDGDRAECRISISAGEHRYIAVGRAAGKATAERARELFDITCAFWKEWIGYCRYRGPHTAMVRRSALALKLMTYAPTGASVAALTTSLPEEIGGGRNWDYRYCWVRDASLMLQTLASLGYSGEARRFYEFMQKALKEPVDELQIMYGIGMERELPEHKLEHLDGYRGSRPVRTGNGAYDQRQSDLHGYLLEGALIYSALGGKISAAERASYARVADFVSGCWSEPDKGLWEIRGEPQHFVHSKAMGWVVIDRAIRFLGERPGWVALRDRIWRDIVERGRAPDGHFMQAYAGPEPAQLDAALVQLHMMGLPADMETLRSTREAVERELRRGDLLLRYSSEDGVEGKEAAFSCAASGSSMRCFTKAAARKPARCSSACSDTRTTSAFTRRRAISTRVRCSATSHRRSRTSASWGARSTSRSSKSAAPRPYAAPTPTGRAAAYGRRSAGKASSPALFNRAGSTFSRPGNLNFRKRNNETQR